ncbi:MAG: hypothetical protein Q7T97_16665 [Burkholderiaceae bacterium]|nr:hypothetical protein [Burkholderiaceae bacterium]
MTQDRCFDDARARGAATLGSWTQDGTLIVPSQLAQAWGLGAQALETAIQRGDIFEVWVNESPYVPAVLIPLGVQLASKLCKALKIQPGSEKLIFLLRPHGGLGGKTVVQALQSGARLSRIEELADAWAGQ